MNAPQPSYEAQLAEASQLINKRHLSEATALLRQLTSSFPARVDPWFMLTLAYELRGKVNAAERARDNARLCPDYTRIKEGDLLRDRLLGFIRRRQLPPNVHGMIKKIATLHAGDDVRLAEVESVCGRYSYAVHQHQRAVQELAKADEGLRLMDDNDQTKSTGRYDSQWEFNNLMHYLKALIMARAPQQQIDRVYQRLEAMCPVYGTPAHARRIRAMYRYGRMACRLDDTLIMLRSRLG